MKLLVGLVRLAQTAKLKMATDACGITRARALPRARETRAGITSRRYDQLMKRETKVSYFNPVRSGANLDRLASSNS